MTSVSVAVVTGAAGLVGSAAARHFAAEGLDVVGIDNDLRARLFGPGASTEPTRLRLERDLGHAYRHLEVDVRDRSSIDGIFARTRGDVAVVVHAAAQPSHDWAASDPLTDFDVNASGTLNVLEATRRHSPDAVVVFASSNKVYGDRPNDLPLLDTGTRLDLPPGHPMFDGVDEAMPIDASLHSLFGASKVAADVLVQEYGRYFGMATACFRAGTVTGPDHAAAELHGFLAYVVRCAVTSTTYVVRGHGGKQVRDVLHADDLAAAFGAFVRAPREAAVFNIGGGRGREVSVLEAIALVEEVSGVEIDRKIDDAPRRGDHRWWVTSNARLASELGWVPTHDLRAIVESLLER